MGFPAFFPEFSPSLQHHPINPVVEIQLWITGHVPPQKPASDALEPTTKQTGFKEHLS